MRQATSVSRDTLLSLGTCFGKFTKSGKFRLHITALDYISQYAKVRNEDVVSLLALLYSTISAQQVPTLTFLPDKPVPHQL